jgi:hypothetical protein
LCIVAVYAGRRLLESWAPENAPAAARDHLALRLVLTAALVLALTSLAGDLDAYLSGLLTPFPIITSVLAGFTQAQACGPAAVELLSGLVKGLTTFTVFFVLVALLLLELDTVAAFVLATAAALSCHAVLLARATRHLPASPETSVGR